MKSNIFFLTFDSLRADKIYDKNKTSVTPNLDFLIDKGICFTQAISTSDATGLSLGSVFTAKYPFKTGITHFNYNSNVSTYFQILKEQGYHTFATVPDVSFFLKLTANFTERDAYVYDKRELWAQLVGGIGDSIVNRLETKLNEPWIYFIHLMDLHAPFYVPLEFDLEKYGKTRYDRMVSSLDFWIGKFLQEIDLEKTIVVLSADHGDYIPINDVKPNKQKKIRSLLIKGKKTLPILEPVGVKIWVAVNSLKKWYSDMKIIKKITEYEFRSLGARGTWRLYDELIRIPLIFAGQGIPSSKMISEQVRQVDIFPTIIDILKISGLPNTVDGQSLAPFFVSKFLEDIPAYIETGSLNPKKLGKIIGFRTPKYKYLRSRIDPAQNISLFDLQNDPLEQNNLAQSKPEIVKEMENLLNEIRMDSVNQDLPEFDDEETKKIQEELRKLGYL